MANYANLKSAIQQVIRTNGNNEITGAILQTTLLSVVNSLGAYFQFVGVATTGTSPGSPDQNVAYICGPGTYQNFGNQTVPANSLGIFTWRGAWSLNVIQFSGGSGGGSIVLWEQLLDSGTPIARITIDGVTTPVYAPANSSGDSVTWNQIVNVGTKIAEIIINGVTTDVYAPSSGGGGGSVVSWQQLQPHGKKIAEITIDGTTQSVFAPELDEEDLFDILGFYDEIGDTAVVMSHDGEPYYRRFGYPVIGGNVSDYFESFFYARMYVCDISQYQGSGATFFLKCFDQPVNKANYVVTDANDIILAFELGTDYATIRDFTFYSQQYPTAAKIYIVYDASTFPDDAVVAYKKGLISIVEKLNGNVTHDNLYNLQGAAEFKLAEDIEVDPNSCTTINGKKCIVLPDGCTFDFNDYQLKNNTNQDIYLYSNDRVYLTFKDTQKNMMPAIGFIGDFSFLKPVRLSNLYSTISTYREYTLFRESISAIYDSEIIVDFEMGTPIVTDAATTINDITLRDGGGKFFVSALLSCTGKTKLIGLTIENLYPGYGIELGGGCLVKDCTLTGPIKTNGDKNVIRGCSISLDGLKIESNDNVIEDNEIVVTANNINYKGIVIQQSRNIIRRNIVQNGFVGIQMAFFNQHAKEIAGNIIESNDVSGQMEEAIAMDESGMRKMNRGQFVGFVSSSDPLNIIIDFAETISNVSDYVGFPIFGISDATMGLVSHIAAIEQYSGTQYKVTLADRIFQPYFQNGVATYTIYNATAVQQGYKDFRNSMFGVASVFWGNVIRNNIVHRDSICLYGGGFYNVIQDNIVYSDTYIAVYMITTAKNKYMDNVYILPICGNVVTGNIVLNGGVYTEMGPNLYDFQPSSLDSRISTKYIAYNHIAGNVSRVAYFEDFNSVIDTALVMESMVDTVPNKQTVDSANNKIPLYFIDDGQIDKLVNNRGIRALIRNSNGTYKVYAGRASGTYNQTKQFDNL